MAEKYRFLTERIVEIVRNGKNVNPTQAAKLLGENVKTVSATMYYLFKKGILDKERDRRNVYYSLKKGK